MFFDGYHAKGKERKGEKRRRAREEGKRKRTRKKKEKIKEKYKRKRKIEEREAWNSFFWQDVAIGTVCLYTLLQLFTKVF